MNFKFDDDYEKVYVKYDGEPWLVFGKYSEFGIDKRMSREEKIENVYLTTESQIENCKESGMISKEYKLNWPWPPQEDEDPQDEVNEFQECHACSSKSGSPMLCDACVNNRRVIGSQKAEINKLKSEISNLKNQAKYNAETINNITSELLRYKKGMVESRSSLDSVIKDNSSKYLMIKELLK